MILGYLFSCFFALFGQMAPSNEEEIQVVAVPSTPYGQSVQLKVTLPQEQQIVKEKPIYLQLRLRGFALGVQPDIPRSRELVNTSFGQFIQIYIDDQPGFAYSGPGVDPFDEDGNFYQSDLRIKLPSLRPGRHIIRAFPCRSYGESLKGSSCFSAVEFYVKSQKEATSSSPLEGPFLTYNEPSGNMDFVAGKPLLLDFYLSNCELSEDGYQVKLTIDNRFTQYLTNWSSYYIYGLKKGKHKISLQLVNEKKRPVAGSFNTVNRTIRIN